MIACVGGGSNAIGAFFEFIEDKDVKLIGCEAAGLGIDTEKHAATIARGTTGIFHGMKSIFCQNEYGQIAPVYSISAGLDYPGIGPEHANLSATGRAEYVAITDEEAVQAFEYLSRTEGIIPAIESSHAVAYAMKLAPAMKPEEIIVVNLSGRGDRDIQQQLQDTEGKISMSKIYQAFEHKKAFIPFITAGDPSLEVTRQLIIAMESAGADLIEIGIPFSDPIAEGIVIQEADERALAAGTTTDKIFDMLKEVRREVKTPMVFMTYINPVFTYGKEKFMKRCVECEMDGIIVPDLPTLKNGRNSCQYARLMALI